MRESNLKDVIFNLANSGVADLDAKITVSIDDVAVKDSTIAMKLRAPQPLRSAACWQT